MERSDIEAILTEALSQLEREHQELLRWKVHERTLVSHLVCYLRCRFPGYSVDMEYNLEDGGTTSKRRLDGRRVFPDFIVHERGTNENNLLAVECKRSDAPSGEKDDDLQKLRELRLCKRYRHATLIVFEVGENRTSRGGYTICWIRSHARGHPN